MRMAAKKYRNNSGEFDDLIVQNLPFVRHILGKTIGALPDGVDIENLESAGIVGLVEAAQQFDPGKGATFKSFAYHRIRGAIIDELRRNCPLPQDMLQRITKVRRATERMEPPITAEGIAQVTGLTVSQVEDCLEAIRLTRCSSWDEAANAGSHSAQSPVIGPYAEVELAEHKRLLADGIERLPYQERMAVTLYYLEDLRLKEIGAVLGLSESRVSRVLNNAKLHLREFIRIKTS